MLTKSILWKVVTILMTGLLLLSALVQWNDPDPFRWIVCYTLTALLSGFSLVRQLPWWLPLVWAAVVLLASLAVGREFLMTEEQFDWGSFWNVVAMKNEAVELGRELGGLLFVTGWMTVLAWLLRKS
ncbi:MAG: transmembrane 220 family protein [SAR324 cluster bacterium]|nr:transmembrane 220 family protein [SAR324 cluster bacterium]